jgi:oxalate---CoA ligase
LRYPAAHVDFTTVIKGEVMQTHGMERGRSQPVIPIHVQLAEIWQRHLGADVGIDDNFFECGGHSLLVPAMMNDVEEATGKYVSVTRFLENPTIRHLAACLVAELTEDDAIKLVQPGNPELPPLFYFHGDILGGGFYARKLAAQLGAEQSVYTVSPVRVVDHAVPSVEEIARERIELVRKHRPRGPYVLGGFCIGALIAYEVSRQLVAEGEEIRGVFLINPQLADNLLRSHLKLIREMARRRGQDTHAAVAAFMRGHKKLEQLRTVWNSSLREKARFVVRNGKRLARSGAENGSKTETPQGPVAPSLNERDEWLLSAFEWIATAHVPKHYDGQVMLFLTEDLERATPFLVRKWRKAAPKLEAQTIPGDHLTCVTTFGHMLAERLRRQLMRLQSTIAFWMSLQAGEFFLSL